LKRLLLLLFLGLLLVGCTQKAAKEEEKRVGLLVPTTISDPVWGSKGYKGLLKIQNAFDVDVYYKEGMNDREAVMKSVEEFDKKGVTLIFGHGSQYEDYFKDIHKQYPQIQFVYFNGDFTAENVTSLHFEARAMGFFGGMVAAEMSETKHLGVIAAYDWQPEVDGFVDGAKFSDPEVEVIVHYTNDWDDVEGALQAFEDMLNKQADVFYPAGDSYNIPIIQRIKEEGLYVIGFVSDQSDLGQATVLTSTVQHVDQLYELAVEQFLNGKLKSEKLSFDFNDGVISMGKYSPEVPEQLRQRIDQLIEDYKTNGELPNSTEE
jgi:transcriptional activator of comK gene